MADLKGWKPKWTDVQQSVVDLHKVDLMWDEDTGLERDYTGTVWRNNINDELKTLMEPVAGRIAFLTRLGYRMKDLSELSLVEFDLVFRREREKNSFQLLIGTTAQVLTSEKLLFVEQGA